jgi:lysophospholipase L1-like esterase
MPASRCLRAFVVGAVLGSAVTVVAGAGGANGEARFIAALGASVAAGAGTQPGPELANSWATGTNPKVNSIYLRLRERNGSGVRAFNAAAPGAYMSFLQYEAARLPKGVDLVMVDMGGNDACDSPTSSAVLFRSQLEDGLRAIGARAPAARIVVLSIIDHLALWDAVKTIPEARIFRTLCKPATTASGRRALRKAIGVLNHELETVCARHPKCRYDGGAVFRIRWSRADVSTLDYYHPSVAGQRKIADAVWASGAITRN